METIARAGQNVLNLARHFTLKDALDVVIVTFLIILELMKTGKIAISQESIFDEIQITSRAYLENAY